MGADFLFYQMSGPPEPDWDKVERAIKELAGLPLDNWPDEFKEQYLGTIANAEGVPKETEETPQAWAKLRLTPALAEFQLGWTGEHRQGGCFEMPNGQHVMLTGGLSWGDGPTELYNVMMLLDFSGVLNAADIMGGLGLDRPIKEKTAIKETPPEPAAAPLTAEQKQAYLAGGECKCPFCGSTSIEGGFVEIVAKGAWQRVRCDDCERAWNDIYKLVDVEDP